MTWIELPGLYLIFGVKSEDSIRGGFIRGGVDKLIKIINKLNLNFVAPGTTDVHLVNFELW